MPELARWSRALDLSESMIGAVRSTLFAPRAWADRPGIGIGPYLRERRLASGTTLSRAAAELGLPLATLGHYESGRVEVPTSVLSGIVDRFAIGAMERAALCDGTSAFLEWCDSLVERPEKADEAISRAAYAATPLEILDRGPAFIRIRTGLLRARLRGPGWNDSDAFATSFHALWLAMGERRTEAAAALSSLRPPDQNGWKPQIAVSAIARRYLGRSRSEELSSLANGTEDPALGAWLLTESALDLCERRRGSEAKEAIERAVAMAEATGRWQESWMRRRDGVRVSLRLREWSAAEAGLAQMKDLESSEEEGWYLRQRNILAARLGANDATARPAGP
jgi:transcriptional regulator with XRE-family HTH domain